MRELKEIIADIDKMNGEKRVIDDKLHELYIERGKRVQYDFEQKHGLKRGDLTDEERMQLATATLLGGCATTAAAIVIAIVLCLLFCSCTTTRYVPVNETRTEHHWHTDSVHQTDTIINRETTVIRELDSAAMARYGIQIGAMQRAWIVQSDRLQREVARLETLSQQRDTVRDSIPKPYPVEVIKQVPRDLTLWQRIRQSVGDFAIFLLLIFVGCKIFLKFLPDFHNPNSKE